MDLFGEISRGNMFEEFSATWVAIPLKSLSVCVDSRLRPTVGLLIPWVKSPDPGAQRIQDE